MKIVAIIQARLQSTRLPKKVLLPLSESKNVLECMLERVQGSRLVDKVIVAVACSGADQELITFLEEKNIPHFAGSEDDVLDRYRGAAEKFCRSGDTIVRLTSDCPVIDPKIIDRVIQHYLNNNLDFASNSLEPYTFPDGMDTEVFSYENLLRAAKEAHRPSEREHVTFYFWKNPEMFKIGNVKNETHQSSYRLTLDYPADYELLKKIYEHFSPRMDFTLAEIIIFLDSHPEVKRLNADVVRNAGWKNALEKDQTTS